MNTAALIQAVDEEIARLQRARLLLSGDSQVTGNGVLRRKRVLSPEARQRIVDAQRKRWAKQKRNVK